jgi:hypothetical protein
MNTAVFCVCGYTVKNVRQMPAHEKGLGHRTHMHVIERCAAGFAWIQTRYRDWFEWAGLPVEEGPGKFHPGKTKRQGWTKSSVERVLWVPQALARIVTCGRDQNTRMVFLKRFAFLREADRPAFLQALDAAIRLSSPEDALDLIFEPLPHEPREGVTA